MKLKLFTKIFVACIAKALGTTTSMTAASRIYGRSLAAERGDHNLVKYVSSHIVHMPPQLRLQLSLIDISGGSIVIICPKINKA